jgi:hypothetical protein
MPVQCAAAGVVLYICMHPYNSCNFVSVWHMGPARHVADSGRTPGAKANRSGRVPTDSRSPLHGPNIKVFDAAVEDGGTPPLLLSRVAQGRAPFPCPLPPSISTPVVLCYYSLPCRLCFFSERNWVGEIIQESTVWPSSPLSRLDFGFTGVAVVSLGHFSSVVRCYIVSVGNNLIS